MHVNFPVRNTVYTPYIHAVHEYVWLRPTHLTCAGAAGKQRGTPCCPCLAQQRFLCPIVTLLLHHEHQRHCHGLRHSAARAAGGWHCQPLPPTGHSAAPASGGWVRWRRAAAAAVGGWRSCVEAAGVGLAAAGQQVQGRCSRMRVREIEWSWGWADWIE